MKGLRFSLLGDRVFVFITLALLLSGTAIFFSSALGLLARDGASISHIALTQFVLGVIPGIIALVLLRLVPPNLLVKMAVPAYIAGLLFTALVFVPSLGVTANNAVRWLNFGFFTVQPSEFLKVATVLMLAAYLSRVRGSLSDFRKGLLPLGAILALPAIIFVFQPNTSTLIILGLTTVVMYFLAGAPLRDFFIIAVVGVALATVLVMHRPYLKQRVETFIHPSQNSLTSGYQIQQSLIAIGSGGTFGRGFGQSVEKFNYLPEPVGDSIFAIVGEELGFVGASLLVLLFLAFALRGFAIAASAANPFGTLLVAGLTLLIILSALLNVSAMLGALPLTGLPLPFISQGGSALFVALASIGLILNVAASRKR